MTKRVLDLWSEVDVIAGYKTYIDLIRPWVAGKKLVSTGMRQEIDRCREVVEIALEGQRIALVSSGDAGVYGMAGILIECLEEKDALDTPLEIIPGISAANAAASLLGAPLMHDYAVLSLSDLLTPWEVIQKRVKLAAEGDFVMAIYNPKSKGRQDQIEWVRKAVLEYRSPATPVGIVREALRGESQVVITTLEEFTQSPIDMLTTVIIGNSNTRVVGPYMVTPRGYVL
ncbi:precorrin-3 methyltransferase [Desulfitobacterium dichloroeliminans LMG P-21439]|uniref:Precorrin-3 methyltransferase n=1 Tax=Desulfitobacterium dichloroeliminans (strain LMG P-21439 / DCA1) TaxID=871963 RepID=L0F6A3_DESDL|nr:precorrin-3B C(17)-methyltransferase [Desulfitobacterium dichloroeliminans]AGA68540.1 precorrin-3 methyltransferase [Desulfitobacterium dichloroeliminans LMG P-21439]